MSTKQVLTMIAEANDNEITQIALALMERQKRFHPDWEAMYISFPIKQAEECKQILRCIWAVLRKTREERRERG